MMYAKICFRIWGLPEPPGASRSLPGPHDPGSHTSPSVNRKVRSVILGKRYTFPGLTLMDCCAKTTLCTYDTCFNMRHRLKTFHFYTSHCWYPCRFANRSMLRATGPGRNLCQRSCSLDMKWCLSSMDSNLEAFSCVPSGADLGILVVQLDTFIK